MSDKCFCHFNGFAVKDATARKSIEELSEKVDLNSEHIQDVLSNVAKLNQIQPEFASSIEGCTDPTKVYVLPDGYIYGYMKTLVWKEFDKNLLPTSTVSGGGSVFNGNGYILNKRLNSSATEKDYNASIVTGFIPVTKNSVLRIKHFSCGSFAYINDQGNHICLFNSSYGLLTTSQQGYGTALQANNRGVMNEETGIYTVTLSEILDNDDVAFVRVSTKVTTNATATDDDASKVIITVDEEIVDGYYVESFGWANTGHAFVPADYEDRIVDLEDEIIDQGDSIENHSERIGDLEGNITDHESRLLRMESEDNYNLPAYWISELKTKAETIQKAMEGAGRNKSAFLWYTDAHWLNNSKMSPALLKYLAENTPINKVNFGGDIVCDPSAHTHDNIKYVYDWRKQIANLPNHHSVYGNHDLNHRTTDVSKMAYAYMLACEETSNMVVGGESYYYIDNPSEKTRYLYLSYFTNNHAEMTEQGQFIVDAISTVAEGWHIVVIAHRWWQYTSASNPATTGSVPAYESEILSIFDSYNARTTRSATTHFIAQDFTTAQGKVEFCIGGHIHVDYDFTSDEGIPVIITASDTNQDRSSTETEDSGTLGTVTESAVFGIVADYDNNRITVVGVGRGGSRIITY